MARMLEAMFPAGSVVELRCPDHPRRNMTTAGYFDDFAKLVNAAAHLSGKCPGVYITLNEVPRALLARLNNRVVENPKQLTSDGDVTRRRWLFIDIDPKRPAGIPANADEHAAAQKAREEIRGWLSGEGWPMPIEADSGNGAYLLYKIDLAANDGARQLVRRCLQALAFKFDDKAISVDTSCFNAGRIAKLIGTLACKGDATEDRPHRLSRLLAVPDPICLVPADLLEALAKQGPPPPPKSPGYTNGFDLEGWISRHNLPVAFAASWEKGRRWILNPCPWNADHTNRSAFIVQFSNGAIAAGCHHNGCQGHDWHALRDLVEPDWRGKKCHENNGSADNRSRSHPYRDGNGNESDEQVQDATVRDLITAGATTKWAWRGWLPIGELIVLASEPGVGKTRLCADLARRIYHAMPWPDGTAATLPARSSTLWVAADCQYPELSGLAHEFSIPPECMFLNASKSNPFAGTMLDSEEDLKDFEARIARVKPGLVFVDTTLKATDRTAHKPEDAKAFFTPLQHIAQRQQTLLMCVTHTNVNGKPLGRRIEGAGRVVMMLECPDPEGQPDRRKLYVKKSHSLYPPALGVTMGNHGNEYDTTPPAAGTDEAAQGKSSRLEEVVEWLHDYLAAAPARVHQVRTDAEGKGFSTRTLYKAKDRLVLGEYELEGKKWWRLTSS
jgi:hypothetical protein